MQISRIFEKEKGMMEELFKEMAQSIIDGDAEKA